MKKLLTLALLSVSLTFQLFGQAGIPGFFELTVEDLPGSATNRAVVKARAVSTIIPTLTTCNGEDLGDNIIAGHKFAIRWPVSSNITSVTFSPTNNTPAACPDIEENTLGGYSVGTGSSVQEDNGWRVRAFQMSSSAPIPTPTTWVLNQWMTICTLSITLTPACTICDQLDIYMIGDNPTLESGLDLDHVLAFDQNGSGTALEYDLFPNNGGLPLDLIAFEAEKFQTQDAKLSWVTANEENTSHFSVQRSYDKKLWTELGTVEAAGYSVEIRNYTFMDEKVYNGRDSRLPVYYRLNMVDLDGKQRFSPIESVIFGNSLTRGNEFTLYPNPAAEGVQVEWDVDEADQPTALEFYDIAGKLIYTHKVGVKATAEYVDFNQTQIHAGVYMVRIMSGETPISHQQLVVGKN